MRKRLFAGMLAGVMLVLSGCSIGNTQIELAHEFSSKEILQLGNEKVSVAQMKVFLCNYQNIYGESYGINMWQKKFHTDSLEEYIKAVTLDEITRIVCMKELAVQEQVMLTDQEKKQVKAAAKEYYDSLSEEELSYTGAAISDIEALYEAYALANKVYQTLVTSIDEEVSDDEARVMEAQLIYVSGQRAAAEIQSKLSEGADFAALAHTYNEAEDTDVVFGRGTLPQEVETVAFSMENGEVSDSIQTEDGYYFLKCINKFNQELTDENKEAILRKREEASFQDKYGELLENTKCYLNEEAWAEIELVTDGSITTDSFFEVYEEKLK
ncbi:MAG: peptidyl-prolyl cis-trans isomerase [Lachnospiraceae bacterium]|nr:peptidyl-prolyl cis-trans isomerase [Lachnospiraceae bacterium]